MFIFWILIFLRNARKGRIPSSSSMQPRKHATRLSINHLFLKVTQLKEPKKINSLSPRKFNEVTTHLANLCLLFSFLFSFNVRRTMNPKQIEYFETWFLPDPGWKSITGLRGSKLALFWQSLWINKIEFKWSSSLHQIVSCVNSQFWSRMVVLNRKILDQT